MFPAALLFALLGPTATKTWYGPATASFETQFAGNPYDPLTNDVRIRFTASDGKKIERLAYFVDGTWRADLVAETPGDYTPELVRNGVELPDAPCVQSRILLENRLEPGFLHTDPSYPNRFRFDDGSPFVPVGHNLAWPTKGRLPTEDQLVKMGENGLTWTRFWATARADRNPWWPRNDADWLPKELWPPALDSIAAVEHACDLNGVSYQLVMFDDSAFSSAAGSDWAKNPWNVSNGGFLKSAADFFSDPEALRRTKMWLRYAVARYGSDPNLMAFELFNEVENTDAARQGRWAEIDAWTKEMAAYIRSLDSYDHMITISADLDEPELWKSLDYYQPHSRSIHATADILSAALPHDRPLFFGQFETTSRAPLRDALYTGLFANAGGLPMVWDWDEVEADGLYPELATAAKVVKDSDIGHHPVATRLDLSVVGCMARGIGSSDWALLRVIAAGSAPYRVRVGGLSIVEGACTVETIDLDSGKATTAPVTVTGARLTLDLPAQDCIVVVKPA
ncbi:MAG: glycoside hydrolase 5 family protein [Fimbriimonadaceae bacterium]